MNDFADHIRGMFDRAGTMPDSHHPYPDKEYLYQPSDELRSEDWDGATLAGVHESPVTQQSFTLKCVTYLGEGGSAWVYACHVRSDASSGEICSLGALAVKVLKSGSREDFEHEAKLHLAFSKTRVGSRPPVPRFFSAGTLLCSQTQRTLYAIVMESVGADASSLQPLTSLIPQADAPPEAEVARVMRSLKVCAAVARSLDTLSNSFAKSRGAGVRGEYSDLKANHILIGDAGSDLPYAVILDHSAWRPEHARPIEGTPGVHLNSSSALGDLLGELMGPQRDDSGSYARQIALAEVARLKHQRPPRLSDSAKRLDRAAYRIKMRPGRILLGLAVAALVAIVSAAMFIEIRWYQSAIKCEGDFRLALDTHEKQGIDDAIAEIVETRNRRLGVLSRLYWTKVLPSDDELALARDISSCIGCLDDSKTLDKRQSAANAQGSLAWTRASKEREHRQKLVERAEKLLAGISAPDTDALEELRARLVAAQSREQADPVIHELIPLTSEAPRFDEIAPDAWRRDTKNRNDARVLSSTAEAEQKLLQTLTKARGTLDQIVRRDTTVSIGEVTPALSDLKRSIEMAREGQLLLTSPWADSEREQARHLVDETTAACGAYSAAAALIDDADSVSIDTVLRLLNDVPNRQAWLGPTIGDIETRHGHQVRIEAWIASTSQCLERFKQAVPVNHVAADEERLHGLGDCISRLSREGDNLHPQTAAGLPAKVTQMRQELVRITGALEALQLAISTADRGLDEPLDRIPEAEAFTPLSTLKGADWDYGGFAVLQGQFRQSLETLRTDAARRGKNQDLSPTSELRRLAGVLTHRHVRLSSARSAAPNELQRLREMAQVLEELAALEESCVRARERLLAATRTDETDHLITDCKPRHTPHTDEALASRFEAAGNCLATVSDDATRLRNAFQLQDNLLQIEFPSTDDIRQALEASSNASHFNKESRGHRDQCLEMLSYSEQLDRAKHNVVRLSMDLSRAMVDPNVDVPPFDPDKPVSGPSQLNARWQDVCSRIDNYAKQRHMVERVRACVQELNKTLPAQRVVADVRHVLAQVQLDGYDTCAQSIQAAIAKWLEREDNHVPSRNDRDIRLERLSELGSVDSLAPAIRAAIFEQKTTIESLIRDEGTLSTLLGDVTRFEIDSDPESLLLSQEQLRGSVETPRSRGTWIKPWQDDARRRFDDLRSRTLHKCRSLAATPTPVDEAGSQARAEVLAALRTRLETSHVRSSFDADGFLQTCDALVQAEASARSSQLDEVWRRMRDNFEWWIGNRRPPVSPRSVGEFLKDCEVWLKWSQGVHACTDNTPFGKQSESRIRAVTNAENIVRGSWEVWRKSERLQARDGTAAEPNTVFDYGDQPVVSYRLIGPKGFDFSPSETSISKSGLRAQRERIGKWSEHQSVSKGFLIAQWISGERFLGYFSWDPNLSDFNASCQHAVVSGPDVTFGPDSTYVIRLPTDNSSQIALVLEIYFSLPAGPDRTEIRALFAEADTAEHTVPRTPRVGSAIPIPERGDGR